MKHIGKHPNAIKIVKFVVFAYKTNLQHVLITTRCHRVVAGVFSQLYLPNFSKEFYHWKAVSDNEAQRLCI